MYKPESEIRVAFRQIEGPLKDLLQLLRINIENQLYGVILVDDRGGRIPGLIIRRVINKLRQEKNLPPIPLIFVPNPTHGGLELQIAKHRVKKAVDILDGSSLGKRALVTTEYINYGSTVENIGKLLTLRGLDFDITSVIAGRHEQFYRSNCEFPLDTKLFFGRSGSIPLVDIMYEVTGLTRRTSASLRVMGEKEFPGIRLYVAQSRQEVDNISTKLLKHFGF